MGACSSHNSINLSYHKNDLIEVQSLIEAESDILPIYNI